METNDLLILLVIIVAILASGFMFYIIVGGLNKNKKPAPMPIPKNKAPIQQKPVDEKQKHLFPLQVQAYERLVLLLERIEPSSLVMRSKTNDMTAQQLHGALLNNLREEYEHNVAQQIYVSDNAWNLIKQAKEETINIVNSAANSVDSNSTANELTRTIFQKMMVLPKSPSQIALEYVKTEVKTLF